MKTVFLAAVLFLTFASVAAEAEKGSVHDGDTGSGRVRGVEAPNIATTVSSATTQQPIKPFITGNCAPLISNGNWILTLISRTGDQIHVRYPQRGIFSKGGPAGNCQDALEMALNPSRYPLLLCACYPSAWDSTPYLNCGIGYSNGSARQLAIDVRYTTQSECKNAIETLRSTFTQVP